MKMKLGIDFGTSFSTMCVLKEDGKPHVLRDADGNEKIPSVVYWGDDGVKVGQAASDILGDVPSMDDDEKVETLGRLVKSVKRELLPRHTIALPDGSVITPVEVVAEILKYLKRNAEDLYFHAKVSDVSLTHPATFTEAQKKLLTNAAKQAGFSDVRLMAEPIAAAMGYVASGAKIGKGVLVFDLGGGTFDLAYLQKGTDGEYHFPVPPLGDARCGGDDFDQIIYDWADKRMKENCGSGFSATFDVDLPFLVLCRQAKERLSRSDSAKLRYYSSSTSQSYSEMLAKDRFEDMISAKVDATISLVERMMGVLEEKNLPVDTVLLVGGSTRIPVIAEKLKKILPVEPIRTIDTDTAVVMGSVYEIPAVEVNTSRPAASSDEVLDQVNVALGRDEKSRDSDLLRQVQVALLRRQLNK